MTVTALVYGPALASLTAGQINLSGSHKIKVMLCTSAYTPNAGIHAYVSHVTGEVAGAGYTAGGLALTGLTRAFDVPSRVLTVSCDDVTWPNATITARYAVFYDGTPTDATVQPLLCCWDLGADQHSSTGPFTLGLAAAGLLKMQAV